MATKNTYTIRIWATLIGSGQICGVTVLAKSGAEAIKIATAEARVIPWVGNPLPEVIVSVRQTDGNFNRTFTAQTGR